MPNPVTEPAELVSAFVNTYEREAQTEALADPDALTTWLDANGLGAPKATARDLARAHELREALRAVLAHHNGLELDPAAARVVDDAAARAQLTVVFDDQGDASVEPKADGVDGALGGMLAAIVQAQRDDTWARLKACAADDCRWAFYDRSRNRSAVWCDMKTCGNRHKVRSFRARQA